MIPKITHSVVWVAASQQWFLRSYDIPTGVEEMHRIPSDVWLGLTGRHEERSFSVQKIAETAEHNIANIYRFHEALREGRVRMRGAPLHDPGDNVL